MAHRYGLIFDVDGVIADSEAVNVRATARAFAEILGIDGVRESDFEEGIGKGAEAYVRAGAGAHGRDLSEEEADALVTARQDNFLAILGQEELPAYPGVRELISSALADEEFAAAIATSSTRPKSQAVLDSAGVPYEEMVYVCGDDITRKKPDPELFSVACRRLGLAPDRCLVIEDAPSGVQAARAAGCRCIAVTNTSRRETLQSERPDMVVGSLSELSLSDMRRLIAGAATHGRRPGQ